MLWVSRPTRKRHSCSDVRRRYPAVADDELVPRRRAGSSRPPAASCRRRRRGRRCRTSPVTRTDSVWFDPAGARCCPTLPSPRTRARHDRADRTRRARTAYDDRSAGPPRGVEGEQKRRGLAVDERAAEGPFVDPPLLRQACLRKRIARVQPRVAEREVEGAVIGVAAGLGDDLDPAAPGTLEFRGIRILVDLDLLDRRRRHADLARLHAVHDQRGAVGTERRRVEETRQGPEDVAVEDRECRGARARR